jgi:hypothetical protein
MVEHQAQPIQLQLMAVLQHELWYNESYCGGLLMAVRIQVRRGTTSEWNTANPTLFEGEFGYNTTLDKFKIGDGTTAWSSLEYAPTSEDLSTSLGDYIELIEKGAADGVAELDGSSNVLTKTAVVFEGANIDAYETTLVVTEPSADRTITIPDVTGTVITTGNLSDITNAGTFTGNIVIEGATVDDYELTLSAGTPTADRTITFPDETGTVQLRVTDVSDTEIGYLNGVTSAIQTQLDNKLASATASTTYAPLASPTFTGTVTLPANTISQSMMSDDSVGTNEIGGLAVTEAKIADGAVTSVKIANGTIINEDINASAAIALSKLATDPLARANHTGTQTASTISDFDTQVRTSKITDLSVPTSSFSMNSQKITSLATPTDATDAATKAYVDAVTEGLHIHTSVVAATTANVDLSTALENGDTLDGITLATGNRILVKNQTTQSENGIYIVQASGQPARATDFDTAAEVDSGDFVFVSSGTVNGSTGWVQTNKPATIGTDAIAFTQFSGAGTYVAGTGLTLTGNSFSVTHPVASQSGNSGKYLTTDGTNTSWGTVSGYSAPTLGSTSVASGATVSNLNDITINSTTIPSSKTLVATDSTAFVVPSQTGNSGKYLTTDGTTSSWGTLSGYNAPTLGSTSIASGATVTTINGLTLTTATLTTPTLTLSSTTSSTDGQIGWISAQDKITVGDGTSTVEFAPSTRLINQQTSSYALVLTDKDKIVEMNVGSANNLTVPLNSSVAYPIGTVIDIVQVGSGQTTVVATGGVTINSTSGLKIRTQWGSASLIKRAENTWVLIGDVAA